MAERFLLYERERSTMASCWTDGLYCSILKNGTLSLRLNKYELEYGSWWSPSVKGIRTPEQFIQGFRSNEFFDISTVWEIDDILPELFKRLPKFALAVKKIWELDGEKTQEFFHAVIKIMLNSDYSLPENFYLARSRFNTIFDYIIEYFETHDEFPVGEFFVGETRVIFHSIGAHSKRNGSPKC